MSGSVVARIAWKELRSLRSLWLTLAAIVIAIQASITAVVLYHSHSWKQAELVEMMLGTFQCGYFAACLYAIAAAAASFTSETEGRTASLLHLVPVRRSDAFVGKLGYGIVSTAALLALLALAVPLACALTALGPDEIARFWRESQGYGLLPPAYKPWLGLLVTLALLKPLELIALGLLYSLLVSDVLIAGIAGATTWIALSWVWGVDPRILAAIAAGVFAIDYWLLERWLHRLPLWTWSVPRRRGAGHLGILRSIEPVAPWKRTVQRLLWKELNQAWPFAAMALAAASAGAIHIAFDPLAPAMQVVPLHFVAVLTPVFMGVAAYHVDQKGRVCRTFGERGVAPDATWLMKHVVWIGLTIVVSVLVLPMNWKAVSQMVDPIDYRYNGLGTTNSQTIGTLFTYLLVAYSIGQFFGMMMSRAIVAFASAAAATAIVGIFWLVVASIDVPRLWTVDLIPIVLFVVTWVRTGSWQIQNPPRRSRLKLLACLGVPAVGVALAIIVYRVYQIALTPWQPVVEAPPAGSTEARTLWVQAAEKCEPSGFAFAPVFSAAHINSEIDLTDAARRELLKQQAEPLAAAYRAAAMEPVLLPCVPEFQDTRSAPSSNWMCLARLLWLDAREHESRDKLDEALRSYRAALRLCRCLTLGAGHYQWARGQMIGLITLRQMQAWSAHPKQTTDRVRGAIREVELLARPSRPTSAVLAEEWTAWRSWLDSNRAAAPSLPEGRELQLLLHPADRWLPWDAARAYRLVDVILGESFIRSAKLEADLAQVGFYQNMGEYQSDKQGREVTRWIQSTHAMYSVDWRTLREVPYQVIDGEAYRRMLSIAMATASFRREHGRLPEALHELGPIYFESVPRDPWTGTPFQYEPQGATAPGWFDLKPDTPFLLSAGLSQMRIVLTRDGTTRFMPAVDVPSRYYSRFSFWHGLVPLVTLEQAHRENAGR